MLLEINEMKLKFFLLIRQSSEVMLAKICSMIVIVFIVCNLPRLIIGMFEISRYLYILLSDLGGFFLPEQTTMFFFLSKYYITSLHFQDLSDFEMLPKWCFLLCPHRAVVGRLRSTLPGHLELFHQLHHLLRGWIRIQKGVFTDVWVWCANSFVSWYGTRRK